MIKYLFCLLIFFMAIEVKAFDSKEFKKACERGASMGQEFLQSKHLKNDLKIIKKDCVPTESLKKELKKLDKKDSFDYGCGAGIALSLHFYKQMNYLRSPRVASLIEKCKSNK